MKTRYFEVSADWMKACGKGEEAKTFEVAEQRNNLIGGRGFDTFVDLKEGDYIWTVAVARGKFVESMPVEEEKPVKLYKGEFSWVYAYKMHLIEKTDSKGWKPVWTARNRLTGERVCGSVSLNAVIKILDRRLER